MQKSEEDNKYDEEVQLASSNTAKFPKIRAAVLRAFIRKEYMKNRYKE